MKLSNLKTNHMLCPVIDTAPEFSWLISSDRQNTLQTAYRISVSDSQHVIWNSGKVNSDCQSFIHCDAGLSSCKEYTWTVTVWDNYGNCAEESSTFETAFLDKSEWKAKWSESPFARNESKLFTYGIENPVTEFRKEFDINVNIKKARLFATCYGCYRVFVNGKRPDEREFAPEFTPYGKILNYQTYDITERIKSGSNCISFLVGDGWFFCPQTETETSEKHDAHAILFQIEIEYADGKKQYVYSDGTEKVRQTNIVFSDLFMGEKTDLNKEYSVEKCAVIKNYDKSVLRAQPMPPVFPAELIPAKRIYTSPSGEMMVDFGQVIAGRARIFIDAPKGAEINFEYTEVVDKDGNYFSTMSLRQCDTVISDGNTFLHEALFTYHGFRYIRVTGLPNARPEDFTAVLLTTEKENTGSFTCSDERFNRLYKNIRYSQKNNMLSVPTDCPTREKAGWTGDILIYSETAALNENVTPFLTSWLRGLAADQLPSGVIPLVSPLTKLYDMVAKREMSGFNSQEQTGIAGWGDAIVWVPYSLYNITGNKRIIKEFLPYMKLWCEYIIRTAENERGTDLPEEVDKRLWNTGFHFGEWLVPGKPSEGFDICKETASYIAPYFACRTMEIMAKATVIAGEKDEHYAVIHNEMKDAIINGLFETDALPKDYMGAYALAFAFNLVPDKFYEEYKTRLVTLVEEHNSRLATGFLGTPFLLPVLDKLGRHDLSMKILLSEEAPSWLYEVKMGATAIWENWLAMQPDGTPIKTSFDHYAFGCIDSYIFHTICGISFDPGCKKIIINPTNDDIFKCFRRTFVSEAGEIIVERSEDELTVTIPANTTADVFWKNKKTSIGSGTYIFMEE